MSIRRAVLGALSLVAAASSTEAAIDFEGSLPAGWSVSGGGSLAISADHYRLGSESLRWSWQGGGVLTATGVAIDPAKVLGFYDHTCDLWLYSDTVTAGDALTIEFLNGGGAVQWRFAVRLNFRGWRHLLRSYKYDMEMVGGGTDLRAVRFIAPATGSGSLFLDDLEWVRSRQIRRRDRAMPDVAGYYSDTLHHTLENLPPDLPPDPPTAAELAALPEIEAEYWASLAGTDPSPSTVANAKIAFGTWNIVRAGPLIKGNPIDRVTIDEVDGFLGVLARAWHYDRDTQARDMVLDMVDHLLDQGWAGGSAEAADGGSDTYATRGVMRALVLMHQAYSPGQRAAVKDLLQWRLKRGFFWDPDLATNKNTDYIYTESQALVGLVLGFSDTVQEKVENLRGLKQYFERFIAFSPGTSDGIKPDGTGFHHWTHYNNYMYAFGQLANRLHLLRDSPFQVDQASYETFRDACYVMALMCNDRDFATGFCGRKPLDSGLTVSSSSFARLAMAGGAFYGQAADPKLARFHNRVWGDDAALAPFGVEPFPTGFWSFSHSPAGVYRTGNAVVTMKGLTDTFWGTEIYSNANRYGRYQSYGSVEVMYPGGRAASGVDINGWDWNCPPGATSIRLPFADLEAIAERQDELAQTRFCGALSADLDPDGEFGVKGRFGLFGIHFRQKAISATHNDTFTFRKSVFAFDGKLLCLGSDIANDDAANETATTLFQGVLPTTATPTVHQGANLTAFPLNATWSGGSRWFLDHLGTGYYLQAGHLVKLARTSQASPPQSGSGPDTTGDFAKAWISHGTAPSGAAYEYVVLPGSDATAIARFAADMAGPAAPYTVLRKDSAAHIVHLTGEDAHGYVCFKGIPAMAHGPVTATSGPALLWTKRVGDHLRLSYANPELDLGFRIEEPAGLVTTDVRLDGDWLVDAGDSRAERLSPGDGSTILRFTTRHGLPVEIGLLQVTRYADWQALHFSPGERDDPAVSGPAAAPAGDGLANAFKYAWDLDPWARADLAACFPVRMDGGAVVAGFQRSRARPDVALAMEQSFDLVHWVPLPGMLVDDQSGIETWEAVVPVVGDRYFVRIGAALTVAP